MTYDKTYENTRNVFGDKPEKILKEYVHKIRPNTKILDIGVGQGRNAFYLARKGFQIDGIDPSQVSTSQVLHFANKNQLEINAYTTGFREFSPKANPYSAILVFGLIQILDWDSIYALIKRINLWTQKGSLVFVTAFSTTDASYGKYRKDWKEMKKNSFFDGNNQYRTFLEPGQIEELFTGFHPIYHWEGLGPLHHHGNGQYEQHGLIEFVIEKN
jgi:cyclopropane fatty-acyl-phospholipid synthase-like methyltransferase